VVDWVDDVTTEAVRGSASPVGFAGAGAGFAGGATSTGAKPGA
jgi:hypothetical protein